MGHIGHVHAAQPTEPIDDNALLIQGRHDGQVQLATEGIVLGAAAWRDMHDARALLLAHLVPEHHAVRLSGTGTDALRQGAERRVAAGLLIGGEIVKGAVIGPAFHLLAADLAQHLVRTLQHVQRPLGEVIDLIAGAHLRVDQFLTHGGRNVTGERPGRGGPHEQGLAGPLAQRKPHGHGLVGQLGVTIGDDLMLADAGGAARAPGHRVGAAVKPAVFPALVQHVPDDIVVLVGEGKVRAAQLPQTQPADNLLHAVGHGPLRPLHSDDLGGVLAQLVRQPAEVARAVPVHPESQPDRLLGLDRRHAEHALLAAQHKAIEAILLNVFFRCKAQFLFDLDFYPETLAVKAVLVAQLAPLHGPEAAKKVLVGASPTMMHAHRIVGRDRAIDKRPGRLALLQLAQVLKGLGLFPETQYLFLLRDIVHVGRDWIEWHGSTPPGKTHKKKTLIP